ncbi:MAG: hypothetical protein NTX48_22455 [Planctomycetales bacterium]|nr:hypothetical protein [Planctomycetales bacterium]
MTTVLDATKDVEATQQPVGTDRLAVIVPGYDELGTVAALLPRLEVKPGVSQIIVAVDGSTDRTSDELAPWQVQAGFNTGTRWLNVDLPSVVQCVKTKWWC